MFKKETYINRRKQLKAQFDSGILLFLGNEESSMNYLDNTYRFRQDSSFLYYFGLDYPISDYSAAWSSMLTSYLDALDRLLNILKDNSR